MYVQVVTCYRQAATEPDTHNYNYGTGLDRIIEQTNIIYSNYKIFQNKKTNCQWGSQNYIYVPVLLPS